MLLNSEQLDGDASPDEIDGWESINRVSKMGWTSEDGIVANKICAEAKCIDTACWDVEDGASFERIAEQNLHARSAPDPL